MMQTSPERRPTVEMLMMHPRICFILKSLDVDRMEQNVLRKEQDLVHKDKAYQKKCKTIETKLQ
jgi:hypothetical protein